MNSLKFPFINIVKPIIPTYTRASADLVTSKVHTKYSNIKSRGLYLAVVAAKTSGEWREEGRN